MRSYNYHEKFKLTGSEIDRFADIMDSALTDFEVERQNRIRIRISIEEAVLRMRDHFGEDKEVSASIVKRFGKAYIQVEVEGEAFNPLSSEEHELEDICSSLLMKMGLSPQYSYSGNTGILRINLPLPEMNPVLKLVIAVFIGIAAGVLGRFAMNDAVRESIIQVFLNPVYELWSRILNVMSGPVIFFMVITTILNTGRISKRGANSLKIIGRYFAMSIAMAVVSMAGAFLFYDLARTQDAIDEAAASGFLDGLFGIVPANFFDPFMESNTPQLLLMAIVLGSVMNLLGERAGDLRHVIRQINMVGLQIAEWISSLVPTMVCIFLMLEIWIARTEMLTGLWYCILASFLISVICLAAVILYVSFKEKIPLKKLLRKLRDPFILTLRSGSLDTAYGTIEKCCISSLGIDRGFTVISIPSGLVLYMPVNSIGTLLFMSFAAVKYDISITPLWCIIAAVLSVILFVATPPVPGANLLAYVALFARLGIPGEVLIDAMIFDIIFGIFASASNQLLLQLELVLQADRTGLLNKRLFYS